MAHYFKFACGLILCGILNVSWAQDYVNNRFVPMFQFQLEQNPLYIPMSASPGTLTYKFSGDKANGFMKQYGATLSIPIVHEHVSFDLGLDFRFYEQYSLSDQARRSDGVYGFDIKNLTAPMVYANALFNLPFEGLTASVSGRHRDYGTQKYAEFDYRAKLSYQWKNGIGLEGGWQHQQMSLDHQSNNSEMFRVESLFVDMKYKF